MGIQLALTLRTPSRVCHHALLPAAGQGSKHAMKQLAPRPFPALWIVTHLCICLTALSLTWEPHMGTPGLPNPCVREWSSPLGLGPTRPMRACLHPAPVNLPWPWISRRSSRPPSMAKSMFSLQQLWLTDPCHSHMPCQRQWIALIMSHILCQWRNKC